MIKRTYNYLMQDSLYKNSIYLMASTFVMAILGFFFWMINARLFTTEQIGLATTLISVTSLITSFSLFGLNIGLIRYLPKSKRKSDKINTCFSATVLATIIISTIFLLCLKTFSPRLLFIKENLYYALFFILFMVFNSSAGLIDSIFIAFRKAQFVLLKNTIFSVLKLIFPFFLITLGAYGIFSSVMTASIIGFIIAFIILISKFNYRPQPVFYETIIKKIGRFSFGNYIAGFIGGLPKMILPLMILNMINAETAAYYYMAMMIASLLFIIPRATTQSLFAEGSYNEKELKLHIKKAIKIIALILIPGIIITIFLGKYILLAFGKEYSIEGFRLLQMLALGGVFVGVKNVCGAVLRVKYKIKEIIFVDAITALSMLGLSYFLIPRFVLIGVGLAWIIENILTAAIFLIVTKKIL